MPIGVKFGTIRRNDFMERLINASLPRICDFNGINSKFDGRGNYTLGLPGYYFPQNPTLIILIKLWVWKLPS